MSHPPIEPGRAHKEAVLRTQQSRARKEAVLRCGSHANRTPIVVQNPCRHRGRRRGPGRHPLGSSAGDDLSRRFAQLL